MDSTTVASRVSRPKADTREIFVDEQAIVTAHQKLNVKMTRRINTRFWEYPTICSTLVENTMICRSSRGPCKKNNTAMA